MKNFCKTINDLKDIYRCYSTNGKGAPDFNELGEYEKSQLLDAAMNDYAKNKIDLRYELVVESPIFQKIVESIHAIAKNKLQSKHEELLKSVGAELYEASLESIEPLYNKYKDIKDAY